MSSLLFLVFFFLYYAAFGKEKDIYHVITGEPDTPLKRNLDPVYYVGVYDKKPLSLPSKYEIELMTADSGKRFTCIIPKDDGSANTNNETSKKGADSDSEETLIANNKQKTELESEIETETEEEEYMDDEVEPVKTTEELLQEADTLDNRDRYIQEFLVQSQNLPNPAPNRKKTKSRNSHCYFSREGYWNYELCLYDKISQFHGNKNKRDPNIKLGDFTAYIDVSKILMNDEHYPYLYLKDIYGLPLFENTEKNFVHLLYTAGHHKRQSLVTLQCSKAYGKRSKDGIIKISEPKIHHYHFIFIYKAVCEYDNWLQREYNIYDDAASSLVEPVIENTAQSESHTATDLLWEKGIDPSSDDIALLLSPLLDAAEQNKCLLLKQGWWTVEFCYGSFIRQIHLEAKKQTNKEGEIVQSVAEWDIKQEHVIGKWAVDAVITSASYMIHRNANDPQRTYASIVYDGGDECDVTKQGRKTEIQFRCALNERSSQLVKSREDPSCYYIAQVETPLLCQHPAFKIPSAPKHEIVCYPFDEKEFVEPASLMKQVADIEAETDEILRMVTTAAKLKYEEEEEQQQKQKGDDVAQEEEVEIENKIPPKLEL